MSVEELSADNIQSIPVDPIVETGNRSEFINKTYTHLLGAILLFAGIEYWIFSTPYAEQLAVFMLEKLWLAVQGGFIVVSWIATHVAHAVESIGAQYAALVGFVVAEAIIFVPMFYIALMVGPEIIEYAVAITLGAFVALTAIAMITGANFTFLRSFLVWSSLVALATIVLGAAIGFHLGTYFSMGMIGIAGASILYDTSKIMRDYPDDRYVAAAMQLLASIALMLWYVLRLFLSRR